MPEEITQENYEETKETLQILAIAGNFSREWHSLSKRVVDYEVANDLQYNE